MNKKEVINKIKADGGFTVFWATMDQQRAELIDRLVDEGIIITEPESYPFIKAKVNEQKTRNY